MTTIAYRDGVMAADSLLSARDFIRSLKTIKVWRYRDQVTGIISLVGAAGRADDCVAFARWVKLTRCAEDQFPDLCPDSFHGMIVNHIPERKDQNENGTIIYPAKIQGYSYFHKNPGIQHDMSSPQAAGSGIEAAITAMDLGCTAIDAVKVAMLRDCGTGGPVRFVSFAEPLQGVCGHCLSNSVICSLPFGHDDAHQLCEQEYEYPQVYGYFESGLPTKPSFLPG